MYIATSRELCNELQRQQDSFITVILNDVEYVIDHIAHIPNHFDGDYSSHLALVIRNGGQNEIKR